MFKITQPPSIIFGKYSARNYSFPENCLVITSKGAISRGWLEYLKLADYHIFDKVEPNPDIETTEDIISQFRNSNFSDIIGLGGGSSLDVAKFVANKMKKFKILIPTTFGSGSEVTRISVLKVNGKKKSFHDDRQIADVAIVDSHFIENSPFEKPLHKIYEHELCLSPIPSLAMHCTNINSVFGLPPNFDWKKIWEENGD